MNTLYKFHRLFSFKQDLDGHFLETSSHKNKNNKIKDNFKDFIYQSSFFGYIRLG